MKALSIIGIILFTWLIINRYNYYDALSYYEGKTITYTAQTINLGKQHVISQILIGGYGLLYAVLGTVYFFKKREETKSQ